MTVYIFKPLLLLRLNPGSELFLGRHYLRYLYSPYQELFSIKHQLSPAKYFT